MPGFCRCYHSISRPSLESPTRTPKSIVYAGLEYVEFIIGEGTIIAEVHHVVLNLGTPVVRQSIFGSDAKHPPTGGLVDRDRAERDAIYAARDGCACVSPGPAYFAVDQPTIEGVAEPGSKRRDPIKARGGVRRQDRPRTNNRGAHTILYGSPCDVRFDAQDPLRVDLEIVTYLTTADKASAATVGPSYAQVAASIESSPVIEQRDWRRRGRVSRTAHRIDSIRYGGCRCEHYRSKTQLD